MFKGVPVPTLRLPTKSRNLQYKQFGGLQQKQKTRKLCYRKDDRAMGPIYRLFYHNFVHAYVHYFVRI